MEPFQPGPAVTQLTLRGGRWGDSCPREDLALGEIPQISARKEELGAERGRIEWSVSEGLQSEAEKILPSLLSFFLP